MPIALSLWIVEIIGLGVFAVFLDIVHMLYGAMACVFSELIYRKLIRPKK